MTEQEKANIGADFESFIRTNVGKHLVECAERDEIEALRKLSTVPADDKDAVYKLQLQAGIPKKAMEWIKRTIISGKASRQILETEESY